MQTCIFMLGILLQGQVADADRYAQQASPAAAPPAHLAQPGSTAPSSSAPNNSIPPAGNPLRATTPPAEAGAPQGRLAKVTRPADLFAALVKATNSESLTGSPLSLAEAVEGASSRPQQTRRVQRYWELSRAVSTYRLAALEAIDIRALGSGIAQPNPAWVDAQQAVAMRTDVAKSAVEVAQHRLHSELGRGEQTPLPLPSDTPLCAAYDTRFDEIFQGRASREAEQLSRLLPLRYEELGQNAADATAARQWLGAISQQRGQQDDGLLLLNAYQQLALQRRAFVATAYEYNDEIAQYTQLAVPQNVGTVRLVAMLIPSDGVGNRDWQGGGVRRASAEEPAGSDSRSAPRTFAQGNRNEVRRVRIDEPTDEPADETTNAESDVSSADADDDENNISDNDKPVEEGEPAAGGDEHSILIQSGAG